MWLEGNEVPKIKKYFRLAQWLSHPNNFYILRKSKSACRSSSLSVNQSETFDILKFTKEFEMLENDQEEKKWYFIRKPT